MIIPTPTSKWHKRAATMVLLAITAEPINAALPNADYGTPLTNQQLSELRGGFIEVGGLRISFTFASATHVDGALKAETIFEIPNLNTGNATVFRDGSSVNIIQSGPGNTVAAGILQNASAYLDIIQNSLDQTLITHAREINIEIKGMSNLRGLDTSGLLVREAVEALR